MKGRWLRFWLRRRWILSEAAVVTRHAGLVFGCDYCRDDQNRWFGHVTQVASSEDRGTILLECPRCGALYENTAGGDDQTRRLTVEEAAEIFPDRRSG